VQVGATEKFRSAANCLAEKGFRVQPQSGNIPVDPVRAIEQSGAQFAFDASLRTVRFANLERKARLP
jgi:hypothetical protein